jgi:methylated-DNA-protein-cysteine methyltransferase-like protein
MSNEVPAIYERIYLLVRRIPAGMVSTYGDIGIMAGCDGRTVGAALAALGPEARDVPWQRVISRDGTISTRGLRQEELLAAEGVRFDRQGRVVLAGQRWHGPDPAWAAARRFQPLPPFDDAEQLELF